jgi:hypothetical protein
MTAHERFGGLWRALGAAALCVGCGVGEGEGSLTSDHLYIENCWSGPLDLRPDFFAATPSESGSLTLRIQRGDNPEEQSDGLNVLVADLASVRMSTGQTLKIGLPRGVTPPGVPITLDPDPPKVSLAIYLNSTCRGETATVYSISGQIIFHSIFSGNVAESSADNRLTDAEFSAVFADPRKTAGVTNVDPMVESTVQGKFRFYFQRGQPAQPFQ